MWVLSRLKASMFTCAIITLLVTTNWLVQVKAWLSKFAMSQQYAYVHSLCIRLQSCCMYCLKDKEFLFLLNCNLCAIICMLLGHECNTSLHGTPSLVDI